jgi:hypothetical protein
MRLFVNPSDAVSEDKLVKISVMASKEARFCEPDLLQIYIRTHPAVWVIDEDPLHYVA